MIKMGGERKPNADPPMSLMISTEHSSLYFTEQLMSSLAISH